jgi:hypothetical protein
MLAALLLIVAARTAVAPLDAMTRAAIVQGGCSMAPAAPTLVSAAVKGTSAKVTWKAAPAGCPPTIYLIEAGSEPLLSDLATVRVPNAATTITMNGIEEGRYYVRVRGGNEAGLSAPSNELIANVGRSPCGGLPPPPTGVFPDVKGTTVDLVWKAARRSPVGYLIEAGPAAGGANAFIERTPTAATAFTVTMARGRYYLRIRARNACGIGKPSRPIIVETGGHPGVPDVMVATRTADRNTYFPTIERLRNGDLIVVYYDSPEHASPAGRISIVRSADEGRTWSAPAVAIDTPLDDRDPSVMQTRSGALLLTFFSPGSSTGVTGAAGVFVARSDDDGRSWSAPVQADTGLDKAATTAKIVELDNGDLLLPVYGAVPGYARSSVLRSTDGGRTWPRSGEVRIASAAEVDLVEPVIGNLGSGRLVVLMRAEGLDNFTRESHSSDGGRSWSEPVKTGLVAMASDLLPLPAAAGRPASMVHAWGDWSRGFGDSRATVIQLIEFPAGAAPAYRDGHVVHNTHCDDTAVPSSVSLGGGRLFTVYYDACYGYIGGNFLTVDQLK